MNKKKGKIFFSAMGGLLKAVWKLLLLVIYGGAKLVEGISSFLSKITEKMLN